MQKDIIIIGAGLTGLSTAVQLKKEGFSVMILEISNRVGGQIRTFCEDGFVFESGPNTGSSVSEDVLKLFEELSPLCEIEFAQERAKKRLIWKNEKFHALPSSLWGGITTPLFTFSDKLRVLGEPWRAKGSNPDESIGSLTARRLGQSFLDYAVDPFLSGIYAGDANSLITRHALPKLYNLEQNYGSFIRGAIVKAIEAQKNSHPKRRKGIFSVKGGMENLPKAMAKYIGEEKILLSVEKISVQPNDRKWTVSGIQNGREIAFSCNRVISTVGAYALPDVLPFVDADSMEKLTNVYYAPVVQIAVGVEDRGNMNFNAFGGLVSSKDNEDFLGILFPSSCFEGRCPQNGMLFSFFMGGMKRKELTELTNNEIEEKVIRAFHRMLKFSHDKRPDLIRIFRYKHAIPQYDKSSETRLKAITEVEKEYPGLHVAGNLRDGIGMAHRIIQGTKLAAEIFMQNR